MSAKLLEGKNIAASIKKELENELERLEAKFGGRPHLVAIQAAKDQGAELYLKAQKSLSDELGISFDILDFSGEKSEGRLIQEIDKLNQDKNVHGIFVPMPFPVGIDAERVLMTIDPKKDVEGIHPDNLGLLVANKEKILPCTAMACMQLVDSTGIKLYGKEVVIVGSSKVVGSPVALLMLKRFATTTVCHIGTYERGALRDHVNRAEVLVVAVGKPGVIPGEWVREGAVVIDVGINRLNGKIVGDVVFETARERAGFITPVPGGVGPLTVVFLMKNLVTAFDLQKSG